MLETDHRAYHRVISRDVHAGIVLVSDESNPLLVDLDLVKLNVPELKDLVMITGQLHLNDVCRSHIITAARLANTIAAEEEHCGARQRSNNLITSPH